MILFNLLAEETGNKGNGYTTYIFLGVIIVLFIGMMIFNSKQRKKQAAEDQKRKDSLCKGTKVITIGGLVGTVVSVDHKASTFVLATGNAEIVFDKRAIYQMDLPENASKNQVKEEKPVEEVVEEVKEEKPVEEVKAEKPVEAPAQESAVEVKKKEPAKKKKSTKKSNKK